MARLWNARLQIGKIGEREKKNAPPPPPELRDRARTEGQFHSSQIDVCDSDVNSDIDLKGRRSKISDKS